MTIPGRDVPDPQLTGSKETATTPAVKVSPITASTAAAPSTDTTGYNYATSPITGVDYTDESTTRFNGLPGQPEVWLDSDSGKVYMVYFPPGIEPPVPLLYHVPNEDVLKSYFGDKPMGYDKQFTHDQFLKMGAVTWGTTDAIADTTGDPWAGFVERMDRAAAVMPWLDDPDIFQVVAAAYVEGRDVQDWEFESSDWWQTHSEAERAWVKKLATNPKTAEQDLADYAQKVSELYRNYGIFDVPDQVSTYIRDKWASGQWSSSQSLEQIRLSLGLDSTATIDQGLSKMTGGVGGAGQVTNYQAEIRDLYDTWIGPAYAPDDESIQRWSNQFALSPDAGRQALIDQLRQQRLSLFPEYTNPNSTYRDIAAPWKSYVGGIWGTTPDDTDAEFQSMLRLNDASAISKKAREVGLNRDYDLVKSRALDDMRRQMSGGVRGTT